MCDEAIWHVRGGEGMYAALAYVSTVEADLGVEFLAPDKDSHQVVPVDSNGVRVADTLKSTVESHWSDQYIAPDHVGRLTAAVCGALMEAQYWHVYDDCLDSEAERAHELHCRDAEVTLEVFVFMACVCFVCVYVCVCVCIWERIVPYMSICLCLCMCFSRVVYVSMMFVSTWYPYVCMYVSIRLYVCEQGTYTYVCKHIVLIRMYVITLYLYVCM